MVTGWTKARYNYQSINHSTTIGGEERVIHWLAARASIIIAPCILSFKRMCSQGSSWVKIEIRIKHVCGSKALHPRGHPIELNIFMIWDSWTPFFGMFGTRVFQQPVGHPIVTGDVWPNTLHSGRPQAFISENHQINKKWWNVLIFIAIWRINSI